MRANSRIPDSVIQEAIGWRRHLHTIPELQYDLPHTVAFVAEKLRSFGCDQVVEGIGVSGVVATIKGGNGDGENIGLRADMDALPIQEETGRPYASTIAGRMHACGHDGHTAMLLAAANYLAASRCFSGTVVLIFQPAEEGGAGADAMLRDGLVERFGLTRAFGMHNRPGLPLGTFGIRAGEMMAGNANFVITVDGRGGHAGRPHETADPIIAAGQLITLLQSVVARNVDPIDPAVLSITMVHGGNANNVVPSQVTLEGTVRTMRGPASDQIRQRMMAVCQGVGTTTATRVSLAYEILYPVLRNHDAETELAIEAAAQVVGRENVDTNARPVMGSEDFAFILEELPGAYILVGNGDTSKLHNPTYDFNDDALRLGAEFWVRLAESIPAN